VSNKEDNMDYEAMWKKLREEVDDLQRQGKITKESDGDRGDYIIRLIWARMNSLEAFGK